MSQRGSEPTRSFLAAGAGTPSQVAAKSNAGPYNEDAKSATNCVHILLCTNALFLQHAAVCLTSLLANNPDLSFNIVIIGRATETLDEEKLRGSIAQFSNHSLIFRQFTPPADQVLPLIPQSHYTIDTYTRLWAGEFFPAEVDRVLYLDADIVVVGSIGPLWRTELGGALLGAVDIPGSEQGVKQLGMRADDGYFNAGVLLMDLQQWRETHAVDTVLDYITANPERVMYDQDALNACFHRRRKRLDYKWNVIWPFFREPSPLPLPRAELEAIRRDALIIHYNGASKPWSYFSDHPRTADYQKYLQMTEWRDFTPLDRTPINILRKRISVILPAPAKAFLKRIAG